MTDSTKMTTRLPKTLKDGLDAEARELGISTNELVLMKLSQPLQGGDASLVLASENDLALLQLRKDMNILQLQNREILKLVKANASTMPVSVQVVPASQVPSQEVEPASLVPATELDGLQLRERYNLDDQSYGAARSKAKHDGQWSAPDGNSWQWAGTNKQHRFRLADSVSQQLPASSILENPQPSPMLLSCS